MADLTFEAQAAAVRNVMRKFGLSASDRAHLVEAERVLDTLAKLRRQCLAGPGKGTEDDFSEQLCDEIIKLLHLPTAE